MTRWHVISSFSPQTLDTNNNLDANNHYATTIIHQEYLQEGDGHLHEVGLCACTQKLQTIIQSLSSSKLHDANHAQLQN